MQPSTCSVPHAALFVINHRSGVGRTSGTIARLKTAFHRAFHAIPQREIVVAENHTEIVARTRTFLIEQGEQHPCFLLAGGGSGTLRAIIQGAMEAIALGAVLSEHLLFSALPMGSTNPLPHHFGIPSDPLQAIPALATALISHRTSPCYIYRCTLRSTDGTKRQLYGATQSGLGQFGRAPAAMSRWKASYTHLLQAAMRIMPPETITTGHYLLSSVLQALRCIIHPHHTELVEFQQVGHTSRIRMLAAMLLNFDLPYFPFQSGCTPEEPRMMLCCIPFDGRVRTIQILLNWHTLTQGIQSYEITPATPIEVHFLERPSTVAIDAVVFPNATSLTFALAGTLQFVH